LEALCGSVRDADDFKLIALCEIVPVDLSTARGPGEIGDYIWKIEEK
jgi:hypothetical protein